MPSDQAEAPRKLVDTGEVESVSLVPWPRRYATTLARDER